MYFLAIIMCFTQGKILFILLTAFLIFLLWYFLIVMLNVFVRCSDHAFSLNLSNVIKVWMFKAIHFFTCIPFRSLFPSVCQVFCVEKTVAK